MQAAEHVDRVLTGFEFGLKAGDVRAGVLRLVVDLLVETAEHLLAHRLALFDRPRLRRPEQQAFRHCGQAAGCRG